MTDKTDTSAGAVECLVERLDTAYGDGLSRDCASTLRALAAERDKALAMVAAAYEEAIDAVHYEAWPSDTNTSPEAEVERATVEVAVSAIRTLTPADARAALERVKAEARLEGMERAAQIADYAGAKQMPSDGSYSHHDPVMGPDIAAAIRAETENTND